MKDQYCSRRTMLKAAAAALGAPFIIPGSALGLNGAVAPSNRITIGMIGIGREGTRNIKNFLRQPDARVTALCDVDPINLGLARDAVAEAYGKADCSLCSDFREILARAEIDAVAISTPDHWHVPMTLRALRAGKDVICEKPTLTIAEGRIQAEAVARSGLIFQTSTEDRSLYVYHRMAELVRNGRIGKLQRIIVGLPNAPRAPGDPTPQPIPKGFDYDMWLGPAPWEPYCLNRTFEFRWISDYSGGILTDWGMHMVDTAQWANNTEHSGPVEVEGSGRRWPNNLYNTFFDFSLKYRYANGVEMIVSTTESSLRFEGTEGWVGNTGWIGPIEASSKEILTSVIGPEETHLYTCRGGEHRNFLDCVKSRRETYFSAAVGHRTATVLHLGNAAMLLGRKVRWDPEREVFPDDPEAMRLMSRPMRAPWCYPV